MRAAVRRSYVYDRLPLEAAAQRCGIAYNTARRWKRQAKADGDDWDRARSAARMAQGGLGELTSQVLEDFAHLFQATVEEIKTGNADGIAKAEALSRLSDAYTKTMKAAGGASPQMAELSVALRVVDELAHFIRDEYPDDLERFAQILEPFGARLSEVFG